MLYNAQLEAALKAAGLRCRPHDSQAELEHKAMQEMFLGQQGSQGGGAQQLPGTPGDTGDKGRELNCESDSNPALMTPVKRSRPSDCGSSGSSSHRGTEDGKKRLLVALKNVLHELNASSDEVEEEEEEEDRKRRKKLRRRTERWCKDATDAKRKSSVLRELVKRGRALLKWQEKERTLKAIEREEAEERRRLKEVRRGRKH